MAARIHIPPSDEEVARQRLELLNVQQRLEDQHVSGGGQQQQEQPQNDDDSMEN